LWRATPPAPWYPSATFAWGMFCLSVVITYPIIKVII
jgi:hypothetical protein